MWQSQEGAPSALEFAEIVAKVVDVEGRISLVAECLDVIGVSTRGLAAIDYSMS